MKTRSWARSSLRSVLVLGLLAGPLRATWSIVVVDGRTGEVCVATATCISGANIKRSVPVIVVGKGAGAAQSFVNPTGANRIIIRDGLRDGLTPQEILDVLAMTDPQPQTRQYGIVDRAHPAVTFTGSGAGIAKGGVVGQDGDWFYAIQGNVLTGVEVLQAAEQALLGTVGDMGQRVMAGMEAARALGGDGRCSCAPNDPTGCGVPPPNFTKSAHIACFLIARLGDVDGECNGDIGCAAGNYYLNINFKGTVNDIDPVHYLEGAYEQFRNEQLGRADHFRSLVRAGAQSLPASGDSSAEIVIELVDLAGKPLVVGGAQILLEQVSGHADVTTASAVTDHGDGTYSFSLTSGSQPGEDEWQITVDDGNDLHRPVQLWPNLELRVDPLADLHCGFDAVSATAGAVVPFELHLPADAGKPYWLLGTSKGTQPGIVFRGTALALNPSKFSRFTFENPNGPKLPNSIGLLDPLGRAQAAFIALPVDLAPYLGQRLDWAAVLFGHPNSATANAGFDVVP